MPNTPVEIENIIAFLTTWLFEHGFRIVFLAVGAWVVLKITQKMSEKIIRRAVPANGLSEDAEKRREDTLIKILNTALKIIVWSIAIIMILPEFGINIAPILAGAGVLGLAIGFGAQSLVRDFLAGLFVVFENQYRIGDVVCLDDTCGLVENLTMRKAVLRDLDGKAHHILHGSVTKTTNLTIGFSRVNLDIAIGYKENLDNVIGILNQIGKEMAEEKQWKNDFIKPIEALGVNDFAESAILIKVIGDTKPMRQWDIMREYRKRIKIAFDNKGIEIPYPHRVVITKNE